MSTYDSATGLTAIAEAITKYAQAEDRKAAAFERLVNSLEELSVVLGLQALQPDGEEETQ